MLWCMVNFVSRIMWEELVMELNFNNGESRNSNK